MKKLILIATVAAIAGANLQTAKAGDREWAVGKVLTGVAAAAVVVNALDAPPAYCQVNYTYATPTYGYAYTYCAPLPPPVVYVPSTPVVVYRAPLCVAPPPVVRFQFGYYGGRDHHLRYRRW